jgi:predicted adenine nucleotide alpha hydrolase (AANH) superfamily ATPase
MSELNLKHELGLLNKDSLIETIISMEKQAQTLQAKLSESEDIVKAVAHIGIDWGYGKYELEEEWIDKSRKLYEEKEGIEAPTLTPPT